MLYLRGKDMKCSYNLNTKTNLNKIKKNFEISLHDEVETLSLTFLYIYILYSRTRGITAATIMLRKILISKQS